MLWQLITSSTKQELSTAFAEETVSQIPKSLAISTLATTEEKRSAIAYWEQFPLQNLEDVQPWIESLEPISNPEDLPLQTSSPGEELAQIPRVIEDLQLENFEQAPLCNLTSGVGIAIQLLGRCLTLILQWISLPFLLSTPGSRSRSLTIVDTTFCGRSPSLDRGTSPSRFGFSKEFQDMFLW